MKAEDLRIGNYIQNLEGSIYRINSIYSKEFYHGSYLSNERHLRQAKEFMKPIPISEDWLLRFDFTTDWNDGGKPVLRTEWKVKDFVLFFHTRGTDKKTACLWHDVGFETGVKIRYIHQLQNLYFALTGRELELVNSEKKY